MTFCDGLTSVLHDLGSASDSSQQLQLLVEAYRNEKKHRRYRNRSPRTDLMLGGLVGSFFERYGLVAHVAEKAFGFELAKQPPSKDRYIDVAFFSADDWWSGTRFTELAVEVENNWGSSD